MNTRFDMPTVQPSAYKALLHLENYLSSTSIPKSHRALIKIRASQINGCAYCVDMHTRDARKGGETEQRLALICVWREAHNIFSEEERLLLAMTEEITLIHQQGLSDKLYGQAIQTFGEEGTAQIIMAVIVINGWNRLSVSLRTPVPMAS
jgi:AhpD family alkylhydroperoxidase